MSMADSQRADLIGVIGGGRMGGAIAQIFGAEGFDVVIVEPNERVRAAIPGRIAEICRARGQGLEAAARARALGNLDSALSACALIIEAAPEKLELKQDIFERLGGLCGPDTILATNTSVIPVGEIAARAKHPGRVIGTHFWNPPYAVRLVEVVQAEKTDAATVERTMALMARVGQLPVHVKRDTPGFIGNRLQHALKREAIALVQNGVCDAETVDFVIRNSFGARLGIMGTLEQSDLVGLNLTLDIHRVILRDLDRSTEPQKLLVDLVAAGKTGAAVGEGFRAWSVEQARELRERLDSALLPKPPTD